MYELTVNHFIMAINAQIFKSNKLAKIKVGALLVLFNMGETLDRTFFDDYVNACVKNDVSKVHFKRTLLNWWAPDHFGKEFIINDL